MRRFLAIFATVLLATLITACALSSCAVAADSAHSCCHKHPTAETHLCVYSLLERSQTTPVLIAPAVPTAAVAVVPANPGRFQPAPERPADSSGLFLFLRVLRI
jgi:hypothetical protein